MTKYDSILALKYLEEGKLFDCVELRTGKHNRGGAKNVLNQLHIICKELEINPKNYFLTIPASDDRTLVPRVNYYYFNKYWQRQGIQSFYSSGYLTFPWNSPIGTLFKMYERDSEKFVKIIGDMKCINA